MEITNSRAFPKIARVTISSTSRERPTWASIALRPFSPFCNFEISIVIHRIKPETAAIVSRENSFVTGEYLVERGTKGRCRVTFQNK